MLITDFGAAADGRLCTEAIQQAIDRTSAQGGGRVTVPAGEFLTGSLVMKSGVELHLEAGAVLKFTDDFTQYPIIRIRWEGYEQDSYRPLLYARNAENIAVTGRGRLEGQGARWWKAFRAGELQAARPCFVTFEFCKHVLLADFFVQNSPAWTIHPLGCENVSIRGLSILNPYDSPNTDGIDPESCRNVRISDCYIDVGDDCIAIKAGTEDGDDFLPCENIAITGCTMAHGHGGVVIGSEMSGSVRRVTVTGCVFDGTDRGIRIKTRRGRGGTVENLIFSGISMNHVLCPIVVNSMYFCGKGGKDPLVTALEAQPIGPGTPHIQKILIADIVVTGARGAAACIYGLLEAPVADFTLSNVQIHMEESIPEVPVMNALAVPVTCAGLLAEHVRGLQLQNVQLTGVIGDQQAFRDVTLLKE